MEMKPRYAFQKLKTQLNKPKISVILGPRQVGKTTILKALHREIGGIYLDLDIFSNYEKVASYEQFLTTIKAEGYRNEQKEPFFVFLDEFQRYDDLTVILKNIYDHHQKNVKVFVTGSSSLNIKNKVQESLAGRKITTYLYPLSFKEFLIFTERDDLLKQLINLQNIERADEYYKSVPELIKYLEEFMIYGGYPELVLAEDQDEKYEILESIFDAYVNKDLVDYLKIEKIKNAKTLIQKIAINHAQIANYSGFASLCELNSQTVKNYIEIFKETYIINELKPFFTNKNKEVSKAPKLYFFDNGVRNFFINNFSAPNIRGDTGFLFESLYISELIKTGVKPSFIKYFRTKKKTEVDIIIDKASHLTAIELKYKTKIKRQDFNGLNKFIGEYSPREAYLVNLGHIDMQEPKIRLASVFHQF